MRDGRANVLVFLLFLPPPALFASPRPVVCSLSSFGRPAFGVGRLTTSTTRFAVAWTASMRVSCTAIDDDGLDPWHRRTSRLTSGIPPFWSWTLAAVIFTASSGLAVHRDMSFAARTLAIGREALAALRHKNHVRAVENCNPSLTR